MSIFERPFMTSWLVLALSLVLASARGPVVVHGDEIDFTQDVRPILAENCFACHGPDEGAREARLRLDTKEGLEERLGSYHLLLAGNPEESELYLRLTEQDVDYRMPPRESGKELDETQIDVLRRWIEEGAEWEPHWAYTSFREVIPPGDAASKENLIDGFVERRLKREGFSIAAPADRRTLLRRVSIDLVGMTPSVLELERFLADDQPGAYERAVDLLLESTAYAEHQARRWLDLARYADSHGFTIDGRRSMWPYRDWVVTAIAEDLPFDEFTRQQLAGDLNDSPTRDQLIATGFHRNTQINAEGGAKDEENRVNAVIDRVDTTGSVWLGSSITCARCHTHKYDPVSQTEYFQMFAFFNQTEDGGVSSEPSLMVPTEDRVAELEAYEEADLALGTALREAGQAAGWTAWIPSKATGSNGPELRIEQDSSIRSIGQNPVTSVYVLEGRPPLVGARVLRLEALPHLDLPGHGPGRSGSGNFVLSRLRLFLRRAGEAEYEERQFTASSSSYSQGLGPEGGSHYPVAGALSDELGSGWAVSPRFGRPHVAHFELAEALPEGDWEMRLELHQDHGGHHVLGCFRVAFKEEAEAALVPGAWEEAWNAWVSHKQSAPRLPSTLILRERGVKRPNRVFERGDFLQPRESVEPGVPLAMQSFEIDHPLKTRLDLANWLVDPRNALVHRVTVNREWQHFFGLGLVETEADFGVRGAQPSHPELLEWLAQSFVQSGFSRKSLHRSIVTSATYRQSSDRRPDLDELDPRGRWLGRQQRLRVDAEVIRDSALRASGQLSSKVGGPPVQPPQPEGVFDFTQSRKSWKASEGEDRFRRTMYTRLWRSSTYPFLTTFDAPVASSTCTRRGRSNTALQALTLANDPMMIEIARALGERLRTSPGDDEQRLELAFELCLARESAPRELEVLVAHLEDLRRIHREQDPEDQLREKRVWAAIARVLINLDEFVTRS
jgi:hypothetical protein